METGRIKELVAFLEGALETKIDYGYTGTYIDFYIYLKEYDYAIIKEVQLENKDLKEIAREVMDKMYNEEYYFYKATILENIIKNAIEYSELKEFKVLPEGILYYDGCEWDLNDINEYTIIENDECAVIEFKDLDGNWSLSLTYDECRLNGNDNINEELER